MAAQYNLNQVVTALFRNKKNWKDIDSESKEGSFFIINQYCSKKYPKNAELLNSKGINSAIGTETWNLYFTDTINIPFWFWKKPIKRKINKDLKELDPIDKHILQTFYANDVENDKLKNEANLNSYQTGKIRKNSKIQKARKKYADIF